MPCTIRIVSNSNGASAPTCACVGSRPISSVGTDIMKPLSVNSGAPFELTIAAEQTQEGDPIPFPPEATISLSDSATSKDYPATVNVDPKSRYRAKVIAKQVVVESAGSYSIRVCATIAGTQVTVPWTGRPLSVK